MEKNRIKIAIIIPNLKIAGAQNVVVKIASNLDLNKFYPIIMIINEKENNKLQHELEEKNIDCIFFGKKCGNNVIGKIKQLVWLKKSLNKFNPDIIHVHLDYYFTFLYALLKKKRVITTVHSQPYRIYNNWTRWAFSTLDKQNLLKVVCITKGAKEELLKYFLVKESSVCVIPNPIEIKKYSVDNRTYDCKDRIKFVYVARFEKIKNHHLLITAFYEALKEISDMQLFLAGKGQLYEKEKAYVRVLGIEDKVCFVGEVENIVGLLKNTDIFVISSDSEAFPITLLEAMAAGMPVISTNVGGIPEIIDNNGTLVPKGDVIQLSTAMIELARNKELCLNYSKKSFDLVQQYDIGKIINQYEQLYINEYKLR